MKELFWRFLWVLVALVGVCFVHPSLAESMRIVSLAPNLTETVYALGAGDSVVGTTRQCDFPEIVKRGEKVGDMINPSLELILSRKPTLVLAAEGNPRALLEELRKAKVLVREYSVKSAGDLPGMLRTLGGDIGKKNEADRLAQKLEESLRALKKRGDERSTATKRFLLALQFDPIYSATSETWLGDLLAKAGFENVIDKSPIPYPQVSPEVVIAKKPNIVFLDPMTVPGGSSETLEKSAISQLERILGKGKPLPRVVIFPADILVRPGPRLVEGIRFLIDLK